jgi:hypothetical protein
MYLYLRAIDFWRTTANYQGPQEVISEAKSASEVFMRGLLKHDFCSSLLQVHRYIEREPQKCEVISHWTRKIS